MAPPRKRTKLSKDQPTEILFDVNARQDYLTGFHKRKVARAEHAKEQAEKKAREEKIAERKQIRDQRKADLLKHVHDVNVQYRKMNPDLSSEDEGSDVEVVTEEAAVTVNPLAEEEEYVDEDKYTTVTVEAMDASSEDDPADKPVYPKPDEKKSKPSAPKKKKKKFRYESKAERKETRMKQKAKNARQAKARKEGSSHS